jgi:hypothetical protein
MVDEYAPPPKFIRTETIFSLLSPIPTLISVIFSITGYVFLIAGDGNGAKTFLVIALFAAFFTLLLTTIALCIPRKKKGMAGLMFVIAGVAAAIILMLDPGILNNLDFWSAPGDATYGDFMPKPR